MNRLLSGLGRIPRRLPALLALITVGALAPAGASAASFHDGNANGAQSGTVQQTNLVSDLPGVAALQDPHLVNAWGISESSGSPFWISDNNAGVSTLYAAPGSAPISIVPLVVNIPTPVGFDGGTPTGTVFNVGLPIGSFRITGPNSAGGTTTAPALFLFATEDGTIAGWNPGIDPTGHFDGPGAVSTHAVIAVDSSGNNFTNPDPNQQTGAVYKGLAVATSAAPIIAGDGDSKTLLYASNFRAGTVEVYDAVFHQVTALPTGAFTDPGLPAGYAPFNVQVLDGKVYVDYALQDATRHDDVAGPHHGFVDVFNLDGTPGLAGGAMRLISRGPLDSPWGLAIAPQGFAGLSGPGGAPVLLVGNFGDGRIHAFDATTGSLLGRLKDPDGEPIRIDGLWALKVGNGGNGGAANTVYFTAGPFGESHGLFGSLATVAPGTPEGPAEAQWVQAWTDVVEIDQATLDHDIAAGAPPDTIKQDTKILEVDTERLLAAQSDFAADNIDDTAP
jgi:uncharacterized protein (TIGR03118 family)